MPSPSPPRADAVIGGGIAGLAAAHRLRELAPAANVTLFEAGDRLGGVLHTEEADGFLLEHSADNFITSSPWAIDLCRRIGFEGDLIETNPRHRGACVVRAGRLVRVPEGFVLMQPRKLWPLVTSPVLSVAGKLRLLAECLVPRRKGEGDESLASFARRRLGREVYERLVQPLIGGIYTADAERLSLSATMPRFLEMERRHGSLIRAALRGPRGADDPAAAGARYGLFVAPRHGLSSLVAALAAQLPPSTVRLRSAVDRIERAEDGRWRILPWGGAGADVLSVDAVIVALPAPAAAHAVAPADRALAEELAAIEYADSALALVGCRREQLSRPLTVFGFVVPDVEQRPILAASFASVKFPGRAPDGHELIRVFLGGARRPDLVDRDDAELKRIVLGELTHLLGMSGEPTLFRILRWRRAMPQYHLGHLERVASIRARAAALPGLFLAGNAFSGVGIPDCIASGEQAAEQAAGLLAAAAPPA
jgi:oxygen-dependent protoporphyrinogen oxidase